MKRRTFIKTLGATGASLGLSRVDAHSRRERRSLPTQKEYDVAIIGAGLSGLVAARTLANKGRTVCILEARERVGGRTVTQSLFGKAIADAGGQWIGPTQTEILSLAQDLGIQTFPTWNIGETLYLQNGQLLSESQIVEDLATRTERQRIIDKIDTLASKIPIASPWNAPNARTLDKRTLGNWLDEHVPNPDLRQEFEAGVNSILPAPSNQISLLWFLFYVHSAGGYEVLQVVEGGAQESRFVDGAQALSTRMAEELQENIMLGIPVHFIHQERDGVRIFARQTCIRAKRAVIAVMPTDIEGILFSPPLPDNRAKLQHNWNTTSAFKIHIAYETPFWRAQGYNGRALTDTIVGSVFDNTPAQDSPGVLMAFLDGNNIPRRRHERRQVVVKVLTQLFGEQAQNPLDYTEMDWSNQVFTSGCVPTLAPGVLTKYGATLRAPIGNLYWAGTETSLEWSGYMEGAVRAGKRVAMEVHDSFG